MLKLKLEGSIMSLKTQLYFLLKFSTGITLASFFKAIFVLHTQKISKICRSTSKNCYQGLFLKSFFLINSKRKSNSRNAELPDSLH